MVGFRTEAGSPGETHCGEEVPPLRSLGRDEERVGTAELLREELGGYSEVFE